MKKILVALLIAAMAITAFGCAKKETAPAATATAAVEATAEATATPNP